MFPFESVAASKTDTFLQNLTTYNQRTPHFISLCIEMMKIMNKYAENTIWLVYSKNITRDTTLSGHSLLKGRHSSPKTYHFWPKEIK